MDDKRNSLLSCESFMACDECETVLSWGENWFQSENSFQCLECFGALCSKHFHELPETQRKIYVKINEPNDLGPQSKLAYLDGLFQLITSEDCDPETEDSCIAQVMDTALRELRVIAKTITHNDANAAITDLLTFQTTTFTDLLLKQLTDLQPKELPACRASAAQNAQNAAIRMLGLVGEASGDRVVPALLSSLEGETEQAAIEALGNIGPRATAAVESIRCILRNSDDATIRASAVKALGQICGASALNDFIMLLTDTDAWLRAWSACVNACSAIAEIGLPEAETALPVLTGLLESLPDHADKVWIAHALGELGHEDAIKPLKAAYESETDLRVHCLVVEALLKLGVEVEIDIDLILAALDKTHSVWDGPGSHNARRCEATRKSAACALGLMGAVAEGEKVRAALERHAQTDFSHDVAEAAKNSLDLLAGN